MASRILIPRALRTATIPRLSPQLARQQRSFQTSRRSLQDQSAAIPAKKPVGAFRGGYVFPSHSPSIRPLHVPVGAPTLYDIGNYDANSSCSLLTHRHSLFGFLLGAVGAGAGMYYYVLEEYRVSNELLTEDIYVRCPSPPDR
jgi:hypothetical protein